MVSFSFNLAKDDSATKNNNTEITKDVNNNSKGTGQEIALNEK